MAGLQKNMAHCAVATMFAVASAFVFHSCRVIDNKGRSLSEESTPPSAAPILKSFTLPAPEISGLCNFTDPINGSKKILAINDSNYQLLVIDFDDVLRGHLNVKSIDLAPALTGALNRPSHDDDSQWEAVQSDKQGRIYISQEEQSEIHILDLKKPERIGTIKLTIPDQNPRFTELKDAWNADPGSRIEGFVLLDNGHILAAKEKNPPALIEFAPKTERPTGFTSPLPLFSNFSSRLPNQPSWPGSEAAARTTYEAVKFWLPSVEFPKELDLSELAITPTGDLAVLSDRLARLFYIGQSLGPSETKFKLVKQLPFPDKVEKPEGLVMLSNIEALVASDTKSNAANFFHLRIERK